MRAAEGGERRAGGAAGGGETPALPPAGLPTALALSLLAVGGTRLAFLATTRLWAALRGLPETRAAETLAAAPLVLGLSQLLGLGLAIGFGLPPGARRRPARALGLRPVPWSWLLLGWLGGLALQLPLAEIGNLGRELWPQQAAELARLRRLLAPRGPLHLLALLASLAALVPLLEEAFFRGLLLPRLRALRGPAYGLLLSSLLFGAVHLSPPAVLYATAAGLLLGALRLRTGGIAVPVAVHAGVNALPVLLPARLLPIEGFNVLDGPPGHVPWPWWSGGALLAALCLGALWRLSGPAADGEE